MTTTLEIAVNSVNECVDKSLAEFMNSLRNPVLKLYNLIPEASELYHSEFKYIKDSKGYLSLETIRNGISFLFFIAKISLSIDEPEEVFWIHLSSPKAHLAELQKRNLIGYKFEITELFQKKQRLLNHEEIQTAIGRANATLKREAVKQIVGFQARCRGVLLRRRYKVLRKERIKEDKMLRQNEAKLDVFIDNLLKSEQVTLYLLRKVLYILDVSESDYGMELKIQELNNKLSNAIISNRQLQQRVEEADRRIGSLVRNSKLALTSDFLKGFGLRKSVKLNGLTDFSRDGHQKLEAYQHLFYALQVNPKPLINIMFSSPVFKMSQVFQTTVINLFNGGSDSRSEYFLLKFFEQCLKEDVAHNYKELHISANDSAMVTWRVLKFYSTTSGYEELKNCLDSLLQEAISNSSRKMTPKTLNAFKTWMRELTNKRQPLHAGNTSFDCSNQSNNFEVEHIIDDIIVSASNYVDQITSNRVVESIPYGIKYAMKCFYQNLKLKFPNALEKDILKVVGSLLYGKIFDVFSLEELPCFFNEIVSNEIQSYLKQVSKLLKAACLGKHSFNFGAKSDSFGKEVSLSLFLSQSHEIFKNFFKDICNVMEPEEFYNVDEFSEETLILYPEMTIPCKEILNLHQWLVEYYNVTDVGSEVSVLYCLLKECGAPPKNVKELLNCYHEADDHTNFEITLKLKNKNHSVSMITSETGATSEIRVKQAIIELIKHRPSCFNLNEVFFRKVNKLEAERYSKYRERKQKNIQQDSIKSIVLAPVGETLPKLRSFVQHNLKTIRVSNFDEISVLLVKDIAKRRKYRENKVFQLEKLEKDLEEVKKKRAYNKESLRNYEVYINHCLQNFKTSEEGKENKKPIQIKYTGQKLHEKGILISIQDFPFKQLKRVRFQISSIPGEKGVFEVAVNYPNKRETFCHVNIERLLELQYEGEASHKLKETVEIDVNAFVCLINKKFLKSNISCNKIE